MIKDMLSKLESAVGKEHPTQVTHKETFNDISELVSPPRVAVRAPRHGLGDGCSPDLIGTAPEGEVWNAWPSPHARESCKST